MFTQIEDKGNERRRSEDEKRDDSGDHKVQPPCIVHERAERRKVLFAQISGCQGLDRLSGGFQGDVQLKHCVEHRQHG